MELFFFSSFLAKHLSLRRHQVSFPFGSTAEYDCDLGHEKGDTDDTHVIQW